MAESENINKLKQLFFQYTGQICNKIEPLPKSGSNRAYFRLINTDSDIHFIGTIGTIREENHAFIELSKTFKSLHLPVPEIYSVTNDELLYLQQDLGNLNLFDFIESGRKTGIYSDQQVEVLKKVLHLLPDFQFLGYSKIDFNSCYPVKEFDSQSIAWDLNYFKYCFLKFTGIEFNEYELEKDFDNLKFDLLKSSKDSFMYRDFQSRNIIIHNNQPFFIDFQGGRKGPFYYDVASFIWQARAAFPSDIKEKLIDTYYQSLTKYKQIEKTEFLSILRLFVFFRQLQVLGAYGFRGLYEKKQHFIQSIPFALRTLNDILKELPPRYNYLTSLLKKIIDNYASELLSGENQLVVRINSFAFSKGIPQDYSGNGGGFVFDCRSIDNPGRYEQYKHQNGLDKDVISFLEINKGMQSFLDNIENLVAQSIQVYLNRGFTNLMINFGCTGGQHRSVFAAQKLAEYIHKTFNIKVIINHREQNVTSVLLPQ